MGKGQRCQGADATPEDQRKHGLCLLLAGVVLLVGAGIAVTVLAILEPSYIPITIFALVLGPTFIFSGLRRLKVAKNSRKRNPDEPLATVAPGTIQTNHVTMNSETTGQTVYGFGSSNFGMVSSDENVSSPPPYSASVEAK